LLGGKKKNFNKDYFDCFAAILKLNDKQINAVCKKLFNWLPEATRLIDMSFLTANHRTAYKELVSGRTWQFTTHPHKNWKSLPCV